MAKKFHVPIDLQKYELQNAVVQNLAGAPSSPNEGQLYYNTGDDNLYVFTTAGWVDLTVQGGGISYGTPSATINAGDAAVAGSSVNVLREDAQFAVATAAAVSIDGSNAEGNSTSLARANHTHAYGSASIPVGALATGVRLDTINAPTASVALNSQKITGLADGTATNDAINLGQLQTAQEGLDAKVSVRVATTAAGTLASSFENADTVDGTALATGDRILIKDQAAPAENGIYTVNASGAPTRAADMSVWTEVPSAYVWVEVGTTNADTGWVTTADQGGTINSTSMTWTQFSGLGSITAGTGLTKTGNTLDVIGTTNRITANANDIDISSSYVGQASITTLGTITTGVWTGTDVAIADGGTGSSSASGARSNLSAAGYYSSATHGAGTTITITQATHTLRASRGLAVQLQDDSTGDVIEADVSVASSGDVTATFGASQSANTVRVTIVG